jgi:hypothetical protein
MKKPRKPKDKEITCWQDNLYCSTNTWTDEAKARLAIDYEAAELDLKDLKALRSWLGRVIAWAEGKPLSPPKAS